MTVSIADALRTACRLSSVTAGLDTALILAEVLQCDRSYLLTWPERRLSAEQAARFEEWMVRRARGEPVAYILGRQAFWTLDLRVSPATLIPRPETELLVEQALALALPERARVLDLGTGSGAIALALASERPHWQIVATDLSRAALAIAADNALRNGLDGVRFILSDWYDALADARFHLVLSNPPYIDPLDVHLGQGDLRFEPRTALAAGAAGYADLARIIQDAPEHLHPGGWVLVEHGFAQAPRVRELFRQAGFRDVRTVRDLSALERVSIGSWGSEQP